MIKEKVPSGNRGYLYVLKSGLTNDGDNYDLVLGYDVITLAKGLTSNPAKKDLMIVLSISYANSDIKVIPFYKCSDLQPESIKFAEMELIAKRTEGRIDTFFFFDNEIGIFYRREIGEDLIPFYIEEHTNCITDLTSKELERIDKKRTLLKEKGFCSDY